MGRPSRRPERSSAADEAAAAAAAAAREAASASALPWGMATQEMQPSSLTALTDDKLARFVIGQQKKTKFEKDREEREAKKRQADEEAAQIYAKFVASFENEDETLGKAFVRGESTGGARNDSQRGEVYHLKPSDSAAASSSTNAAPLGAPKRSEMARMLDEIKQKDAERQMRREQLSAAFGAPETSSAGPMKKKRREIDQFLEELKEREPMAPTADEMGITKGSYDHGDPTTTNLYVGNLAPTVTEEALEALFRKYGDVYSVKIMWPRTEEERARKRNCGFVSFFDRSDADDARVSLHDRELEGHAMVVNWGKAVKIDHSLRRPATKAAAAAAAIVPPPVVPTEQLATGAALPPQIVVQIPTDAVVRARIDRLAQYVATDGVQFEHAVKLRETPQSEAFAFLFESHSALATYYRWRVYAFAMGDDVHSWRDVPFQMTVNGAVWVPPPAPPSRRKRPRSTSRSRRSDSGRGARTRSSSSQSVSASHSRSPSRGRSHSYARSRHSRSRHSRSRHSRSRSSSRSSSASPRRRRSRSRRRYSRSRSRDRRRRSRSPDADSPRRHRRSDRRRRSSSSSSRSSSRSRSRGRHNRDRSRARTSRSSRDRDTKRSTPAKPERLLTGQQIARARDIERGREPNRLADAEYDELQELLRTLTLEREAVKQTMGFCLDHSEAAVDIVNVIYKACAQPEASAGALVAYLYVTSDILHNSSAAVKNASLFRTTFQARLPDMLDRLRLAQRALTGRMSANAMKDKVLAVLTAWESWSLFPPMFLVGLNATFLRKVDERAYEAAHAVAEAPETAAANVDEERLRKTCQQAGIRSSGAVPQLLARLQWLREFTSPTTASAVAVASGTDVSTGSAPVNAVAVARSHQVEDAAGEKADEELDGEPMDRIRGDGKEDEDEELDGEPMDEDELDGQPLDEDDGDAKDKSNGQEEEEDDDVDGEPMDEDDLDGEPLDASFDKTGAPDEDGDDLDGAPLDDDDDDLDGEPM